MAEEEVVDIELIDYECGHCGGNQWELFVAHVPNGTTRLVVRCANQDCLEVQEAMEDVGESAIVWADFDITGQGFDESDLKEQQPLVIK